MQYICHTRLRADGSNDTQTSSDEESEAEVEEEEEESDVDRIPSSYPKLLNPVEENRRGSPEIPSQRGGEARSAP